MRKWIIAAFPVLLLPAGCTKKFYVEPVRAASGIVLHYYDNDSSARKPISPCVWLVDVVDDNTGQPVIRLKADRECAVASSLDINSPPKALVLGGAVSNLKAGMTYHAEVSADSGVARSASWRQ